MVLPVLRLQTSLSQPLTGSVESPVSGGTGYWGRDPGSAVRMRCPGEGSAAQGPQGRLPCRTLPWLVLPAPQPGCPTSLPAGSLFSVQGREVEWEVGVQVGCAHEAGHPGMWHGVWWEA